MAMGFAMSRQSVQCLCRRDGMHADSDVPPCGCGSCRTAGTATFYDGRQPFSRPDQRVVWRSIR